MNKFKFYFRIVLGIIVILCMWCFLGLVTYFTLTPDNFLVVESGKPWFAWAFFCAVLVAVIMITVSFIIDIKSDIKVYIDGKDFYNRTVGK